MIPKTMTDKEVAPKMEYRLLGRSGLFVSAIGLGGWLTYGGSVSNETACECMKAAYDCGINFFDCAEVYSQGRSEIAMGQAIKKYEWKRCDLVISTKIYWGLANTSDRSRAQNSIGLSRKHIIEGLNASLARLQLDYVDLVYAHRPDKLTPMEEIVRAFNHVIDKGKAFYWGTSEWSAEEIQDAWRVADKLGLIGPLMEQPEYNLIYREKVEKEYAPLYEKHGLGLTTFSPLKSGFLTGKYNKLVIPENSRLQSSNQDLYIKTVVLGLKNQDPAIMKNVEVARAIQPIAEELGVTSGSLALAWVIKNPHVTSAITGASRPEQVKETVQGALRTYSLLTDDVMQKIDKAVKTKPEAPVKRFGMS